MRTAEKLQVLEFLTKVKNIMDENGEARFDELGKKYKKEICDIFVGSFNFDEDGDSRCYYILVDFGGVGITITYEFNDSPSDMYLDADNQYKDIDDMISAVNKIIPADDVVGLLNTSIITADGSYDLKTITLSEAKTILDGAILDSAIGHLATAEIMTELLDVDVKFDRQQFKQMAGQRAIVFKLNGRAPEGVILDRTEVEKIGYDFKLLTRFS